MTTQLDAERLGSVGCPVVADAPPVRACPLDAAMVSAVCASSRRGLCPGRSRPALGGRTWATWFCPAEFEVGEHLKWRCSVVTEGDDKPLQVP